MRNFEWAIVGNSLETSGELGSRAGIRRPGPVPGTAGSPFRGRAGPPDA